MDRKFEYFPCWRNRAQRQLDGQSIKYWQSKNASNAESQSSVWTESSSISLVGEIGRSASLLDKQSIKLLAFQQTDGAVYREHMIRSLLGLCCCDWCPGKFCNCDQWWLWSQTPSSYLLSNTKHTIPTLSCVCAKLLRKNHFNFREVSPKAKF